MRLASPIPTRRLATIVLVVVAALALGGCIPAAPAHPTSVSCPSGSLESAVEQCHLKYGSYKIDTANGYAQQRAIQIASAITPSACQTSLANYHTNLGLLQYAYGGTGVQVAENLYCMYYTGGSAGMCPSAQIGANAAFNGIGGTGGWLKSPGHKANLDKFIGHSVNAGAACVVGANHGVYVAVAQFHNP